MLNILVAEGAAVATDSKSNIVSTRLIPCTRICRPKRLNRMSAFDTDGHLACSWFERVYKTWFAIMRFVAGVVWLISWPGILS